MEKERRLEGVVGEDAELIGQARLGSESAFEAIVEKYCRRVLAYCRRMVRQADVAEDLAQEVFVKLYLALRDFDTNRSLIPFLFRIAHNHCLDWLRVKRPPMQPLMRDRDDGQVSREWPDARPTPERQVLNDEIVEAVERALTAVPETYRSVLVMRHVEEMSYEEIAEALELPMGTVKARIHRGRERLQHELRGYVKL